MLTLQEKYEIHANSKLVKSGRARLLPITPDGMAFYVINREHGIVFWCNAWSSPLRLN